MAIFENKIIPILFILFYLILANVSWSAISIKNLQFVF